MCLAVPAKIERLEKNSATADFGGVRKKISLGILSGVKKGDYVELLAHDDLYVFISPCPLGDQNDTSDLSKCVNWPFRVAIYEGADGPLETAPDPQHKTTEPFEFNKAGRPGMGIGKIGKAE